MRKTILLFLILGLYTNYGITKNKPPIVYLPTQTTGTLSFFRNGMPLGTTDSDSEFIMFALEPTEIGNGKYLRLWFLYQNKAENTYLLEPLKAVKLTIIEQDTTIAAIEPVTPTEILSKIDNQQTISMIMTTIGGVLQTISTQPTTIRSSSGETYTVNDQGDKAEAKTEKFYNKITNISNYYDIYKNSVNTGILRKNSIFLRQSVNGYVYFEIPKKKVRYFDTYDRRQFEKKVFINPEECKILLEINAQTIFRDIEFLPIEGE